MFKARMVPDYPEYRFGERPIDQYIKLHAKRVPRKPSMIFYGTEVTYEELDGYIDRMAALLAQMGVQKGDSVVIFMQNCPQFEIAFFAAQRIGAIAAPFNPMFKAWDLEFELNELKAKVIVANSYLYPLIETVKEKTSLEHIVLTHLDYFLPETPEIPFLFEYEEPTSTGDAVMMMETLQTLTAEPPEVKVDMDDVGIILFTSGTTGLPKGAMLSHGNALYKIVASSQYFHCHDFNVWLQTQPMCHIAGMNYANVSFYNGSTLVVITQQSEEVYCEAVHRYHADIWYGTAIMARRIIDWPRVKEYNLSWMRLSVMSSFGIQTTKELSEEWATVTMGGLLCESAFGMTETHTMDTIMPPEHVVWGSNGTVPFAEMQVKIIENGKECAVGEIGEIVVKNKGIFKGYLNRPDATAEILKDGWLYTGDAGKMDEEGFLYFLGRRKEMMKSLGYSVFPDEVEMYLIRHEAVDKAVVIEKQDARHGSIIKAFIVLRPEYKGKVTEEELIAWAKEGMATYKRPREIEFLDEVPTTSTGKLLRRKLREYEEAKSKPKDA